jgi:hypothetical protein
MKRLALALPALVLFGCPETVEVLESTAEGPALSLDDDHAFERYRVTIETPADAYPGEWGYLERLLIRGDLATDGAASGKVSIAILAANDADRVGEERRGQIFRAPLYESATAIALEMSLFDCDADACRRAIDVDFVKYGSGPVEGQWRVDHVIDWTSEDEGDPPASAVSTISIVRVEGEDR